MLANLSDPTRPISDAIWNDDDIVGDPGFLIARVELLADSPSADGTCSGYLYADELLEGVAE